MSSLRQFEMEIDIIFIPDSIGKGPEAGVKNPFLSSSSTGLIVVIPQDQKMIGYKE